MTAFPNTGKKIAIDDANFVYVGAVGWDWSVLTSTDGGFNYLTTLIPWGGVSADIYDIALQGGGPGTVHMAGIGKDSGSVYYIKSTDAGVTWPGAVTLLTAGADKQYGVSLAVHQQSVYIAVAFGNGFRVYRNASGGDGAFSYIDLESAPGYFDVMSDSQTGNLWFGVADPLVRFRLSTDGATTFGPEYFGHPSQPQPHADWAFGGGVIFVAGDATSALTFKAPSYSGIPFSGGMPKAGYHRSVSVDKFGNGYLASTQETYQYDKVELLRLPVGAFVPDVRQLQGIWNCTQPVVAAVDNGHAVVVAYTDIDNTYVTVQTY